MSRALFAAGASHASQCGWCRAWRSDADRLAADNGVPVSHGICKPCVASLDAEIEGAHNEERLQAGGAIPGHRSLDQQTLTVEGR